MTANNAAWREAVAHRDGECCWSCKRTVVQLTLDHDVPRSRGGRTWIDNLRLLCFQCNHEKGHLTMAEWDEVRSLEAEIRRIKREAHAAKNRYMSRTQSGSVRGEGGWL